MATHIVAPGGANTHPRGAGTSPDIGASALSREKVLLMQFVGRSEKPSFVSILSPAGARKLADELVDAARIAEEERGAA